MIVVAVDVAAEPAGGVDEQPVDRARAESLKLTREGGLLAQLTKIVVEPASKGEMDDHVGY